MKKLLIFIILFWAYFTVAMADNHSQTVLNALSARLRVMGDYHARFEVEAEGNELDGVFAVSGDKYYMYTEDYEIIGDGKVKYEINHVDSEVVIDNTDPSDRNFLSNPTRAFEFADDVFTNSYREEQPVSGIPCHIIVLTPKDPGSNVVRIILAVSRADSLPVELRYESKDLSDPVVVKISKIEHGIPSQASFRFDRSRYPGFEIIDFR